MKLILHKAFDFITNTKTKEKFIIDKKWFELYEKTIAEYNDLDWYYAICKRRRVYNALTHYLQKNHSVKPDTPHISSPTKSPINPGLFLDSLGKPTPVKLFLTRKIENLYFQCGIIPEEDRERFLNKLYDESEVNITTLTYKDKDAGLTIQEAEKYVYYPFCKYSIKNKKLIDMINTLPELFYSNLQPDSDEYVESIQKHNIIDSENIAGKNHNFFVELYKLLLPVNRSEYLREEAFDNDRVHFISTCADIITGGILETQHEVKEFKYGNNEMIHYITDEFEHMFYEIFESNRNTLSTLCFQDVITSINLYCDKNERIKILEEITSGIDTQTDAEREDVKKDSIGRVLYDTAFSSDNNHLTAGWMKERDRGNNERIVSAWCNVVLTWPDDVILNSFQVWLQKTKQQYKPRQFKLREQVQTKARIENIKQRMKSQKVLQYLDIKILSAVLGDRLKFDDNVTFDEGKHGLASIAIKNSSPSRNDLLKEMFSTDEVVNVISDLWLRSRI